MTSTSDASLRLTVIRVSVAASLVVVTSEMESVGPLYENGIRTNDIIVKINNETSNWNNLISSLRFATLGEELELNILTTSNKILNLKFETKD